MGNLLITLILYKMQKILFLSFLILPSCDTVRRPDGYKTHKRCGDNRPN